MTRRCAGGAAGVGNHALGFDVDLLFSYGAQALRLPKPHAWRDVSGSRLNVSKASIEMFVAMIRLRLLYSPLHWVVKVYDSSLGKCFIRNEPQ